MKTYYVLNDKRQVLYALPIDLPEPVQTIFCKDRQTKQRYLMFRTVTENSLTAPKILLPVKFSQYDGISIAVD